MDYSAERKRLVEWLRLQMIGPATVQRKLPGISPLDRYPCGKLYPVTNGQEGVDPGDEVDEYAGLFDDVDKTDKIEEVVKPRRYVAPSAVGFSFFAQGDDLQFHVRCSAVRYKRTGDRDDKGRFLGMEYEREEFGGDEGAVTFTSSNRVDVLQDGEAGHLAGLDVLWRPYRDGWIITVSLFNKQVWSDSENWEERASRTLFEVNLDCFIDRGVVGDYPRVEYSLLDQEEQEIELQYKNRKIRAIGHGATFTRTHAFASSN